MQQVFVLFGDVKPFLRENERVSSATRAKLLEFFDGSQKLFLLKLELVIIIDVGAYFVKATYMYALEGDGLLVLVCYDRILEIRAALQSTHYPNAQAVVQEAFPRNLPVQISGLCMQYM